MKKIVILGSTGQIGRQALEIVRAFPNELKVVGLSTHVNKKLLEEQQKEFNVNDVSLDGEDLESLATLPQADLIIVSVVGKAGLKPTLAALRAGKTVAIATKETLVLAGELVMSTARKYHGKILPLDSEHSALFQCIHSGSYREIAKLHITMGKGKIAAMRKEELKHVTLSDITKRTVWQMGDKITIDSATCLNKSFEVIEAKWLFGVDIHQMDILVHPQYLCHSLVEFIDGSIIGEFGTPDMKRYLQYVMFYPHRKEMRVTQPISLIDKSLSFEKPPYEKFLGLSLGFDALQAGGTMPAVLHGADESAVLAFKQSRITFTQIAFVIKKTMDRHSVVAQPTLDDIFHYEEWAKNEAESIISSI